MPEESAIIFDIEKFAVHDGPGIRTVVFMKGCPLHCIWCHNPESQSFEPELFFTAEKCIGCGWCIQACPNHCHRIENRTHVFDRTNCIRCGKCTEKCYPAALEMAGKTMTVSEVLADVLKDKAFYDNSGGGMTLSGGEPLAHFTFTKELLIRAKEAGLNTAIETSGYAPQEKIAELLPLVDWWLWDIKALPADHKRLTGVESDKILDNLSFIASHDAKFFLRCPMIPGVNDSPEELERIAELANRLPGIQRIDLEPYHPLGEGKNIRLGNEKYFRSPFAKKEEVREYADLLRSKTKIEVYHP